jgi:hypothetical protein
VVLCFQANWINCFTFETGRPTCCIQFLKHRDPESERETTALILVISKE